MICVIGVNLVLGVDYQSYNASGQYLAYLLTPATVCLAVPLYEQLSLLKENLKAVAVSYTHLDVYKRQLPRCLPKVPH